MVLMLTFVQTLHATTATIPFQNIYTNGSIIGTVKTSAANDLITNSGIATAGRVATFSSDKVIQDGGTLLSDLATTTAVNLRLLTMSGNINMDRNQLTNISKISSDPVFDCNVLWGTGTTLTPPGNNIRNVALGFNHSTVGFSTVSIGESTTQTAGAGTCILIGSALNVAGSVSGAIGAASTVTGNNSYSYGGTNTITGANAFIFGSNATNSTANSMLLGKNTIVNIRANGTACDLGTTAVPFRNLILNTGIESTAGLVIGPVTATSIAIGSAAITTTVNGIFTTALASAHGILPQHTILVSRPGPIDLPRQVLELLEHLLTLRMRLEC